MSLAQDRLAELVEWVRLSSARRRAPVGRDWIERGAYAVFVPRSLAEAPTPAFEPEHLPIWILESQASPGLPPFSQPPPSCQDGMAERLKHLVWIIEDGRFNAAIMALTDPSEPLRAVLDRQLPDLDLDRVPALFLPLWSLGDEDRAFVARRLPVVRG